MGSEDKHAEADPSGKGAGGALPESPDSEWARILAEAGSSEAAGLPPPNVATPSDVRVAAEEIEWWRPGWRDGWRFVGWRWVFLLPSGLLLLALLPPARAFRPAVLAVGAKLALLMAAVALTLAAFVVRRAAQARKEPFCIFCGYNLTGLPDRYRCPECGRPYTWRLVAEYRRDPEWFIQRYRALRQLPPAGRPFEAGPVRRKRRRDGT